MWNDGRNLEKRLMEDMEETALGTVNNWCKAVIVWNLMLDNERGPNREGGCQTCYGAVDIDRSDYKTITRHSHPRRFSSDSLAAPTYYRSFILCGETGGSTDRL